MSYIKHNAIIVTNWNIQQLISAHKKAKEIFEATFKNSETVKEPQRLISDIVPGIINMYASFFIAPDGSNEGWEESIKSDEARKEFLDWLLNNRDNFSDYIEISFGGDDKHCTIIRSNGIAAPNLLKQLIEARETIRVWHGMGIMDKVAREAMWSIYENNSPEMKRINEAIKKLYYEHQRICPNGHTVQ